MSYKQRAIAAIDSQPPISFNCPAHGCPNAASVSFDGARWACFFHAKASPSDWPAVTRDVLAGWPATANFGSEKAEYEAKQASARRANRQNSDCSASNVASLLAS